jgi:hypothetical protein
MSALPEQRLDDERDEQRTTPGSRGCDNLRRICCWRAAPVEELLGRKKTPSSPGQPSICDGLLFRWRGQHGVLTARGLELEGVQERRHVLAVSAVLLGRHDERVFVDHLGQGFHLGLGIERSAPANRIIDRSERIAVLVARLGERTDGFVEQSHQAPDIARARLMAALLALVGPGEQRADHVLADRRAADSRRRSNILAVGIGLLFSGRPEEAITKGGQDLRLSPRDPNHYAAYWLLGQSHLLLGQWIRPSPS